MDMLPTSVIDRNSRQLTQPAISPQAFIPPNALICGDVTVRPGSRISFGAQIVENVALSGWEPIAY
jgi:carbonic anhydrase/acetyltransferase-like protein (isoleucine patch superfamily)